MTEHSYVEERDGRHYIRGHRVPVTALAALWREGASPETMVENYPTLTLAQVYGGLAFYLEHRFVIDQHLLDDQATFDAGRAAQRAARSRSRTLCRSRTTICRFPGTKAVQRIMTGQQLPDAFSALLLLLQCQLLARKSRK